MAKIIRCTRCGRRMRGGKDWNVDVRDGAVVAYECPACQTPDENAEAVMNLATLIYTQDDQGRPVNLPASQVLTLPDDPPHTCVGCRQPTRTGMATVGEAEFHLALMMVLGVPDDVARIALRDYTGSDPGMVIAGTYPVKWWLCGACARRVGMPQDPVRIAPGAALPTYQQPPWVSQMLGDPDAS